MIPLLGAFSAGAAGYLGVRAAERMVGTRVVDQFSVYGAPHRICRVWRLPREWPPRRWSYVVERYVAGDTWIRASGRGADEWMSADAARLAFQEPPT